MLLLLIGCFGNDSYDRYLESQLNEHLSQFEDRSTYVEEEREHEFMFNPEGTFIENEMYQDIKTAAYMLVGWGKNLDTSELDESIYLERFMELIESITYDDIYSIIDNKDAEHEVDYIRVKVNFSKNKATLTISYGLNVWFE